MDQRLERFGALLAGLHAAAGHPAERRLAALERLLEPLGEILEANLVLLLRTEDGEPPVRPTWWARWVESFWQLPTDGVVRRGFLLPQGPRIVVRPGGWGMTRMPRDRAARRGAQPLLSGGVLLRSSQPVRLFLLREAGAAPFEASDAGVLRTVVEHLGVWNRIARRIESLRRETVTDELTRIYNYRFLRRTLGASLRRLRARGGALSVVMVDVDNLREYNDEYGHLAASAVLARIGDELRRNLRAPDGWVAKYGGDEFLVVLPHADKAEALAVGDQLRRAVERARVGKGAAGAITCSFGVASAPEDGDEFADLLESADGALFQAKALGRNRLVSADPTSRRDRRRAA